MKRSTPPPLTLRDLSKAQGLVRLNKALGGGDTDMARILAISNKYLKDDPDLARLTVGMSNNGDFYDINKNRVGLTSTNPDVFAHEVGHALDMQSKSDFYKNQVLKGSRRLNDLLNYSSMPAAGLIATSKLEDATKNKLLLGMAGVSLASALPNLTAEAAASINAYHRSMIN